MTTDIHPVERYWRAWRDLRGDKMRDVIKKDLKRYVRFLGLQELPAQVAVPGALWINTLLEHGASPQMCHEVSALAAYRDAKTIWRIDPDLAAALKETRWPGDTPAEALRYIPTRSVVIDLPDRPGSFLVWYDLETGQERVPGSLELRIAWYEHTGAVAEQIAAYQQQHGVALDMGPSGLLAPDAVIMPVAVLPLRDGTLDEALDGYIAKILDREPTGALIGKIQEFRQGTISLSRTIINVLLYAAGNDDLVEILGHRPAPMANKVRRRNAERDPEFEHDHRLPAEVEIGTRFGAVIRQHRETSAESPGDSAGGTKRPHIRAAHPHLYWTGEGRRIPRVRYLPPIAVRGAASTGEAEQVTIRRVE